MEQLSTGDLELRGMLLCQAKTGNASGQTRHIDVTYHYVRNSIDEGFIKVEFVVSEENCADIFTKNVHQAIYDEHKDAMIFKKEDMSD